MKKERKEKTGKAALNMQIEPELLMDAHTMAANRGISLSGLVRMLLIEERTRQGLVPTPPPKL